MADDPTLPSDSDVQRAAKLADSYSAQAASMEQIAKLSLQTSGVDKTRELLETKMLAEAKTKTAELTKQLASLVKAGQLDKEASLAMIKKEVSLRAQNAMNKAAIELQKNQNRLIDEQGTKIEKITKNIKEQARSVETYKALGGHAGAIGEGGAGGVKGAIKGGLETAGKALGGPWGEAIGSFVFTLISAAKGLESVGQVAASKISLAGAATGKFVDSFRPSTFDSLAKKIQGLKLDSATFFQQTGMSWKELSEKMEAAAAAGIKLGDATDVNKIQTLDAAAKATGQSIGAMSEIMVSLRRNTKNMGDESIEAIKVAQDAQTVARQDVMSTTEFTHSLQSLSVELADLNQDTRTLSSNFKNLLTNISKLGVSAEMTKRITGELTKSFHSTGDEWKAFIGSMSGAGGGFVGGLFKTQQRGAGGDLLNRQVDQTKYLKEVVSSIKEMTSGIADPDQQLYMMEQLGKQMGLSAEATQALLKGVTKDADVNADTFGDMLKAQQKAEAMGKDWAERLAIVLEGTVTVWLREIYDILFLTPKLIISGLSGGFIGAGKALKELAEHAGEAGKVTANAMKVAGSMSGLGDTSGLTDIGAGSSKNITSAANSLSSSKNSSGNTTVSVNVNVGSSEKQIKNAFDEAHQKTLKAVRKSNSYAFGT